MDLKQAREDLMKLQARMAAFGHAESLIYYDGVTTAPKKTAANRAQTLTVLSEESYKLSTGEETVALLKFLDEHKQELPANEQRMVHLLYKDIQNMQKVPMDEWVAYQGLLVEADDVWHTAKETSDFALFEPILTKIFDTNRRFAQYMAPEKDPYDFWLNEYEEGLNKEVCDKFFAALQERLVPLIREIGWRPQLSDACLHGEFSESAQEAFSYELMKLIGLDLDCVGLATTEHPFTISLGSHNDVRITTHYQKDDFSSSMFSVIHEGGHAMYDTGSAPELAYTVLDGGVSMGIHESQSRFFENLLGRSRAFCEYVFPLACKHFPSLASYTAEDFYKAVNRVQPSLIRTEADEVTYSLHVLIRYELEKRIMAGELAVHDLPEAWNALYKQYLGVDVPDDARGVLQDSHWSGGSIGYFPSYALGSAYGAQFLRKMKETVDVDACISRGDFAPVEAWLREHIWQYGCSKTPAQILADTLGEPFDPLVFVEYLEKKYRPLYGLL